MDLVKLREALLISSIAFAILHLSYGFGFLTGLFRFAGRWSDPRARLARLRPAGEPGAVVGEEP